MEMQFNVVVSPTTYSPGQLVTSKFVAAGLGAGGGSRASNSINAAPFIKVLNFSPNPLMRLLGVGDCGCNQGYPLRSPVSVLVRFMFSAWSPVNGAISFMNLLRNSG